MCWLVSKSCWLGVGISAISWLVTGKPDGNKRLVFFKKRDLANKRLDIQLFTWLLCVRHIPVIYRCESCLTVGCYE